MSASSEGFAKWACDPGRTLEERFGAELLIEHTRGLWKKKHGITDEANYEAERLRKKARSLDPAHEPAYTRADAAHTEEVLPELKQFNMNFADDRPLRDLSFLRFCPPLDKLELRKSEIRDWSPLACQTSITTLHVWGDDTVRDLRVLSKLVHLQSARLYFGAPWLDLRGWKNLSELRELHFHGNILNLQSIPALPRLRHLEVHHGSGHSICLRTVADLPDMPELRRLFLENTAELDGIERYANLRNLTVFGYFTDLTPLAQLPELTHLTISGGDYATLAPLAKLPQLRRLTVCHEVPPDFLPLADAPRLHEAVMEISRIVPPELASLNAMFTPWSDEFALPQPRPLVPLRLIQRKKGEPDINPDNGGAPRDWADDEEMEKSEARWFTREVNRRLNRLLGEGWGKLNEYVLSTGHQMITISRPEDIDRLPEAVQCLRELIAAARHPWQLTLIVDSLKQFERDIDEIYDDDDTEFNAERQREEWEYTQQQRLERRQFLERKYRLRLQQEMGAPVTPLPETPAPQNPDDEPDTDILESTADEAPSEFDLGTRLYFYSTLTEKALYIYHDDERPMAEMLMVMKAET
jgi:hypothetical protein